MTTKEIIEHLKRCNTQYGWRLSWLYARAIIKRLEETKELRQRIEDLENLMYDSSR